MFCFISLWYWIISTLALFSENHCFDSFLLPGPYFEHMWFFVYCVVAFFQQVFKQPCPSACKLKGLPYLPMGMPVMLLVTIPLSRIEHFLNFYFGKCAVCSNSMLDFHSAGDL